MFAALLGFVSLFPAAATDLHAQALELYRNQKFAEAIPLFEKASKTENPASPEFRESVLLIGQSYFMLSKAPEAIPWLERVPAVNEANYMLGYAYLQARRPADSATAFARLFGLPPGSAAAHLVAGQMMLKKEYEPEAVAEIDKALALDPKLPEANFLLAEIAIFRGDLSRAIDLLNRELALNPNFSMAWYRRGDAFARGEKWDSAIPDLQRAVWLNPDFSGPFILLGKCYFKTANYSNAEGILRRALALDPQNASATYLLGQSLILEGKKEEGRALLEKWKTLRQP